jgi:hypothetical protein
MINFAYELGFQFYLSVALMDQGIVIKTLNNGKYILIFFFSKLNEVT